MDRSTWITVGVMIVVLSIAALYFWHVQKQKGIDSLNESPAASVLSGSGQYTDVDGNPVSLDDYLGQTVVAFAWASWCPSCVEQLELLGSVAQKYDDVVVLAFNRAEPLYTAKSFLEFYNLDAKVELVMDADDHFFKTVSGYSMPETVIFNAEGQIYHHERGEIDKDEIEFLVQQARL